MELRLPIIKRSRLSYKNELAFFLNIRYFTVSESKIKILNNIVIHSISKQYCILYNFIL